MLKAQLLDKRLLEASLRFDLRRWWRCNVKILVVTDGSGGFSMTTGFHLGKVLDIVENDAWPNINFQFTKAHRQNSADADLENLQFDNHNLAQYSQIWLFGVEASNDALSQTELKALTQFMDQGGGIFAAGDHQNLGQAMCAEIPRVRSMRRWHWPNPGPNGEPVAPGTDNATRHGTIVDTNPAIAGLQGSQSDKTPQPILPFYRRRTFNGGFIIKQKRYPHPVLCGPNGVINYLPDHQHEGECDVPADLTRSYTFDGYTTVEYPLVGAHQERPEVIADAISRETDGARFGVIGAYDGHRVNVGRVVVDATWHHWFNVNLNGFIDASDPAHPAYDPASVPAWEEIKSYYRNVAAWLARPTLQTCLRNGGWLAIANYYEVLILRRKLDQVKNRFGYYWQLGVAARDALGRVASQCQFTTWFVEALQEVDLLREPWDGLGPDDPLFFNIEEIETIVLGGIVHEIADLFDDVDVNDLMENDIKKVNDVAQRGAVEAISSYMQHFQPMAKEAAKIEKRMKERRQ